MNNKQKIIVSVTGIFLVLLLLVGLTYGYFLTKISGNTNTKSISVSTANLALVYGDGNGDITATNIQPGDVLTSKTFTVKNDGNDTTSYIVVIDNATSTFNNNDFVYTLSCTSDGESCNGVSTETTFPITGGTLISNTIEVGKTHTYSLTVTYKDTGVDQSEDMGKTFTARVNIADPNSFNPYAGDKTTLAYNIINNAVNVTNEQKELGYAEYRETPLTTPAVEVSGENESTLLTTQDDYGTSYYYRGDVENNYLSFNSMCWRIVRIEGDGSIKIVLAAQKKCSEITDSDTETAFIGTGVYGGDINNKAEYENSVNTDSMKYKFDAWYDTNLKSISNKLKTIQACIGDITNAYTYSGTLMSETEKQNAITNRNVFYYNAYVRLYGKGQTANATLICGKNGTKTSETQIFPLTVDEVVFAGGNTDSNNYTYYLRDNALSVWFTLSPVDFNGDDSAFSIHEEGWVNYSLSATYSVSLRPAISLKTNTTISGGTGTISNPYTIN